MNADTGEPTTDGKGRTRVRDAEREREGRGERERERARARAREVHSDEGSKRAFCFSFSHTVPRDESAKGQLRSADRAPKSIGVQSFARAHILQRMPAALLCL